MGTQVSYAHYLIQPSQWSYEVSTAISVLQEKKLRHWKVKQLLRITWVLRKCFGFEMQMYLTSFICICVCVYKISPLDYQILEDRNDVRVISVLPASSTKGYVVNTQ